MGNSFCGLSPTTPTPPLLEGAGACRSLPLTLRGERKSSKWPTGELDTFSLGLTQGPEQGHTNRREEVMAAWEVHTHSKILLREKVHVSVYTFQMGSLMKDNQKRVYFDSIKGRWLKKWKYLGPNNWSSYKMPKGQARSCKWPTTKFLHSSQWNGRPVIPRVREISKEHTKTVQEQNCFIFLITFFSLCRHGVCRTLKWRGLSLSRIHY